MALSDEKIAEIRKIAISEPLLNSRLVTDKADITAVNVRIELPGKSNQEVIEIAHAARELVSKIEAQYPQVNVI